MIGIPKEEMEVLATDEQLKLDIESNTYIYFTNNMQWLSPKLHTDGWNHSDSRQPLSQLHQFEQNARLRKSVQIQSQQE